MIDHDAPFETEVFCDHLGLVEHMAALSGDDLIPRAPGKLLITTQGPTWVVELIDPDRVMSIRVLGLTLDGTLALANALIRSKSPPWTPISKVRALV